MENMAHDEQYGIFIFGSINPTFLTRSVLIINKVQAGPVERHWSRNFICFRNNCNTTKELKGEYLSLAAHRTLDIQQSNA